MSILLSASLLQIRPDLIITPQVSVEEEGSSVTFTCTSDEEPNWTKGNSMNKFPDHVEVHEMNDTLHSVTLLNLRSQHTNRYNCHGFSNGSRFIAVAYLYVGSEKVLLLDMILIHCFF